MSWSLRAGPAALLLLVSVLVLVLGASPAAAHGVLAGSDPPDGSALAAAPPTATLTFNEAVSPVASLARLVDGTGAVLSGRVAVSGARITLELPVLGAGAYGLAWRVLTPRDGHVTEGLVLFTVGQATVGGTVFAPRDDPFPEPSPGWAARLLLVTALVCGLGLAARSLRRAMPPLPPPGGAAARRRLIFLAAALLLLAAWPASREPPPAVASGTATSGDLMVSVSVTAGGACTVRVASSRRPPPAPIDRITLGATALRPLGSGRYVAAGVRGDRATVVVHRGGDRVELPVTWSVP